MNIGKLWWTNIARSIDRYWQILRKTCMLLLAKNISVHLDWKLGSLLLTNWDCLHFKKESQQAAVKSPPQGWILGELCSFQLSLVMLWNLFHGCYLVVWQEPSADMWSAHYPALFTHTSTSPTGALLSQAAIEGELPLTSSYTQKRRLTEGHPDLFLVHSVLIIFLEQYTCYGNRNMQLTSFPKMNISPKISSNQEPPFNSLPQENAKIRFST